MKLTKASFEIMTEFDPKKVYEALEKAGRTCYKSEDRITEDSAKKFVDMLVNDKKHLSVIEHFNITVRFISNRGFSHELVRHRIGSYSQESTRYCNYSKDKFDSEINCIDLAPAMKIEVAPDKLEGEWLDTQSKIIDDAWIQAEKHYFKLIDNGVSAQIARNVLPIGLKTEIVATYNLRQWKEVFSQRTSKFAHPNMREVMISLQKEFVKMMPEIFGDNN